MGKREQARAKSVSGWLLLTRDELDLCKFGEWYIAWDEIFPSKKWALKFAQDNKWNCPYRAVRGELSIKP